MPGTTWCKLELDLERSKAYTKQDTQKRTSNERFAFMREHNYELRFILINKTGVKDIKEIPWVKIKASQTSFAKTMSRTSQVLFINVYV
jgi:predicted class III extradiol MEMO1 family dioxygenase